MNKVVIAIIAAIILAGAATGTGIYMASKNNNTTAKTQTQTQNQNQAQLSTPTDEPIQLQQRINQQNCLSDTCLQVPNLNYPVATLPADVQNALSQSLTNEYKLQAYYRAVINKFGDLRPFAMIIGAEDQHVAVLNSLFDKYGVAKPTNSFTIQNYSFTNFQSACQNSVAYEQATVNLYNALLPKVSSYTDIAQVFSNLKDAAQNSHLPAFEKCAQ